MIKNKGIIGLGLIVAIVLGIVVVGGGAYYLGKSGTKPVVNNPANVLPNNENQKLPVVENKNLPVGENNQNNVLDNQIKKSETVAPNALLYKGDGFTVNSPYSLSYVTVSKEEHFSSAINFNNGDCATSECITAVKMYIKDGLANKKAFDTFIEEFLNNFSSRSIIFPSRDKITTAKVTVDNESAVQYTFKSFAAGYDGIVYITVFFHNGKGYIVSQKDTTISKFLSSFKFTDSEESSAEVFNHQPGAVKSIKVDGANKWILAVDLLSNNPNWLPGVNDRYLNQNTKIRNLSVISSTKAYGCGSNSDGQIIEGAVLKNITDYVSGVEKNINQAKIDIKNRIGGPIEKMTDFKTLRFDINGSNITAIYDICLP